MPEKELDDAFDKVMSSADRREKAQSAIMRIGLRQRIRRIALTCASAAAMLIFVPWITLKLNDRIADKQAAIAESPKLCLYAQRRNPRDNIAGQLQNYTQCRVGADLSGKVQQY